MRKMTVKRARKVRDALLIIIPLRRLEVIISATKKISSSFLNKFQCKKQSSCKQALSLAWQPLWLCPHNPVGFPPALQFLQISTEALRRKRGFLLRRRNEGEHSHALLRRTGHPLSGADAGVRWQGSYLETAVR